MLTKSHLIGGAKATFDQSVLDIVSCIVDNFNKARLKLTKYVFPKHAFRIQKMYLRKHQNNL